VKAWILIALLACAGCQCVIVTGDNNRVDAEKTSAPEITTDANAEVPLK